MNVIHRGARGVLVPSAMLGFVAGLRSQVPLAILAVEVRSGHLAADAASALSILARPVVTAGLVMSAIGETVVDKLPIVPSRLEVGPLGGRMFFGALAGSLLSQDRRGSIVGGAALGAAGALAGSYAGYHARGYLGRVANVPGIVWAGLEDAVAAGIGILATRRVA